MNRDPRLLYGADIRRDILDGVAADIARLSALARPRAALPNWVGA